MMNDDDRNSIVATLIENTNRRNEILDAVDLDLSDREELEGLAHTADIIWLSAQGAPALEDDPVAALLGLVPDQGCRLDSQAFSRARSRAKLSVSDIASGLRSRGWEYNTGDIFRWQTRSVENIPPAVIKAVAEIVGTPMDALTRTDLPPTAQADQLQALRGHEFFQELVERWAHIQRVSRTMAAKTLESRALATVHRGDLPDTNQLLLSLEALVSSAENTRKS